jgi:malonate decarboxylase gamma subunit
MAASTPFAACVRAMQQRLAARLATTPDTGPRPQDTRAAPTAADLQPESAQLYAGARPVDDARWLWRIGDRPVWVTRALGEGTLGPREAHGLSAAIIEHVASGASAGGRTLWIVGDSQGHEASRRAELLCLSQYLAQLAAVIALARAQGVQVRGALTDTGHSAAFFATALQADGVYALEQARVVAMEPAAIARVLGLPAAQIAALVEDDPLIGQPVRHFARWGSIAEVLPDAAALRARMTGASAVAGI